MPKNNRQNANTSKEEANQEVLFNSATNSLSTESQAQNQNQNHNTKKQSLGPNTKR